MRYIILSIKDESGNIKCGVRFSTEEFDIITNNIIKHNAPIKEIEERLKNLAGCHNLDIRIKDIMQ